MFGVWLSHYLQNTQPKMDPGITRASILVCVLVGWGLFKLATAMTDRLSARESSPHSPPPKEPAEGSSELLEAYHRSELKRLGG